MSGSRRTVVQACRVLAGLVFLLASGSAAGDPAADFPFQRLSGDAEAPGSAFNWGNPAADGGWRVGFFGHRQTAWEIIELRRRHAFDLQSALWGAADWRKRDEAGYAETLRWWPRQERLRGKTAAATAAHLRAMLQHPPHLLVTSSRAWEILPPELREEVWSRVREGMGLVYANPDDAFQEDLETRRAAGALEETGLLRERLPALPDFSGIQTPSYRYGSGRVVLLRYGPVGEADIVWNGQVSVDGVPRGHPPLMDSYLHPWYSGMMLDTSSPAVFEGFSVYLLQVMRWAGRREERVAIREARLPTSLPWNAQSPGSLDLALRSDAVGKATVFLEVLDGEFRSLAGSEQEVGLAVGEQRLALPLPALPLGKVYVAARVQRDGVVEAYCFTHSEVTGEAGAEVLTDEAFYPAEVPVTGTVRWRGVAAGDRAVLRLRDFWEREIARATLSPGETETAFVLEAPLPRSRYQQLLLEIDRDGAPLLRARAEVFRRLAPEPDRFHFFSWQGFSDRYRVRRIYETLRSYGQNAMLSPGTRPEHLRSGMRENLEVISIGGLGGWSVARTLDQLCDPAFRQEKTELLTEAVAGLKDFGGQLGLSFADELYVRPDATAREITPAAREALHGFLEQRYGGDIAALNAAWGTAFAGFGELAVPADIDQPREPMAPWLDFCLFIEAASTRYYTALTEAARAVDPGIRIGMDGIEKFSCFDGLDWRALQQLCNFMILYPFDDHPNKMWSWRSAADFRRPGTLNGFWMAYGSDLVPEVAAQYPWTALFRQLNSIGFYQTFNVLDQYAALYPDGRARPAYAAVAGSVRRIEETGLAALLMGAERETDPIAVHHSRRSFLLSFPAAGIGAHINELGLYNVYRAHRPGYRGHTAVAASSFLMALDDAGYQARMLPTEDIEDGALERFQALVLPFSQSLTEREAEAVRRFVEEGGLLVADYACGVRDQNGNLRSGGGALDEVFGIRQAGGSTVYQAGRISGAVALAGLEGRGRPMSWFVSHPLEETVTGGPLEVTTGRAYGEAADGSPLFVVNGFGKGAAVYLNFGLDRYFDLRPKGSESSLRELVRELFSALGPVVPRAQLVSPDAGFLDRGARFNLPVPGVELTHFRDGEAEYSGVRRDYRVNDWSPREALLEHPLPAHVYDPLTGDYLGFTDAIPFTLEACDVRLFARLPYQVAAVEAVAETSAAAAGRTAIARARVRTVSGAPPGRHVLRVEVRGPDGEAIPALASTLEAPGGEVAFRWIPAFNDQPGPYTVLFRDAASGTAGQTEIRLEGTNGD